MHVRDDFELARPAGRTLGTRTIEGVPRLGVDAERRIAIDQGALRFQPLLWDGWGRQGIAYGPLSAETGWAFSAGILNGHNASQAGHIEQPFGKRVGTWLRAGGTHRAREQIARWLRSGQRALTLRQFSSWLLRDPRIHRGATLNENLAVGLYPSPAPEDPRRAEVGFVVHSSGGDNGELWVRTEGKDLPVLRGLPNVPLLLVIVQTPLHAVYFVSSAERGIGGCYPLMRPMAVTRHRQREARFAGIHQSVLGQIGFRVDTRVYGVRVAAVPESKALLGLVDGFGGSDGSRVAECSGAPPGGIEWSEPAGLVYLEFALSAGGSARVGFGGVEGESTYELTLGAGRVRLELRGADGEGQHIGEEPWDARGTLTCLQLAVRDDGVHVVVDGVQRFLLPSCAGPRRLEVNTTEEAGKAVVRCLQVLPRDVLVPEELRVRMPCVSAGREVAFEERFSGAAGELDAAGTWRKELGAARIVVRPEGGAEVRDARSLTSRGRTIYTRPWRDREFADLEVRVRPPGRGRGEGQEGRAGVVFWQDPDNYVIVGTWLHDHFDGASISSFYRLDGYEDIYDAVWTNVGSAIRWGVPYGLRVLCDGERFTAYVDGRAVLHRALGDVHRRVTSLAIRRVGIVANWEWGNDTGSVFEAFIARR